MRVLHVYRTYFPDTQGGLEEAIRQIMLASRPCGVEPSLFTLSRQPLPQRLDYPEGVVWRGGRAFGLASCDVPWPAAVRLFRHVSHGCDLLHYHFPWPSADLLHLTLGRRCPAVLTYHADVLRPAWAGPLYAPLADAFLARMRCVIATSPQYAASSALLRRHADRVRVVPLTLAAATLPPPVMPDGCADLPAQGFVLFVGVLRYYKGLDVLLDAAHRLHLPLVIAGSGPEGERLQQRCRQEGLQHKVRWLGRVSDAGKHWLLQQCRALVLPSHLRAEAFGVSLLEACLCARPMVSTLLDTGTSYVNLDGETGLVVPAGDALALAAALNRLAADDALCQRLGAAAQARYLREFHPEHIGPVYRQIYDAALQ